MGITFGESVGVAERIIRDVIEANEKREGHECKMPIYLAVALVARDMGVRPDTARRYVEFLSKHLFKSELLKSDGYSFTLKKEDTKLG